MKTHRSVLLLLAAAVVLSACASPSKQDNSFKFDRKQQVAYDCGTGKKKQTMRAMYALNQNKVVAVQIRIGRRETPVLLPAETVGVFANQGVVWRTSVTDAASVTQAHAQSLHAAETRTVRGKVSLTNQLLAQNCHVNQTR